MLVSYQCWWMGRNWSIAGLIDPTAGLGAVGIPAYTTTQTWY